MVRFGVWAKAWFTVLAGGRNYARVRVYARARIQTRVRAHAGVWASGRVRVLAWGLGAGAGYGLCAG